MVGHRRGRDLPLDALNKLLAANRYAMATAFRTARALDLPWPTTVTPVTPSNGAPPYSE